MKSKVQKILEKARNPKHPTLSREPRPTECLFSNGSDHFKQMISDINHAKSSIDLETYIFQKDALANTVVDALCSAAKRGVTVRILVDGAGTPYWSTTYAQTIEKAGGETRIYHPFPWQLWNYSRSYIKAPLILKWIFLFLKANKRNHRKSCLIDNKIAYIGSINVSKDHFTTACGGNNWRDTSIRLSDMNFSNLHKAFEHAWTHRSIKERLRDIFNHFRRNPIIRLNYTWVRRRVLYKHLLRRISASKRRIWITNAYFVPDTFLLRRVKEAARSGIDVRILLPKKSDVFMMPWASSTFYEKLLKSGVRIFEYQPSNLHAKTLIIDNWMLVGSSNLNHRSLLHDLEVDINIRQPESKKQLAELFLKDLEASKEISIKDLADHRPWLQRFLGNLVLYMKYWI